MHSSRLSPSMMCADIFQIHSILTTFQNHNIDFLHMDVMDGHFVPNITLGTDYMTMVREHTSIPFDYHMMVQEPLEMLRIFDIRKGDMVSVHIESTPHLHRALAQIHDKGATPMAVLNPGTPIGLLEDVLPDLGGVLLMTVNPGFAGQKLIPQTIGKITRLRTWLDDKGYPDVRIEVDGNVSFANAQIMRQAGADTFVCGTSSIFGKEEALESNISRLRMLLDNVS